MSYVAVIICMIFKQSLCFCVYALRTRAQNSLRRSHAAARPTPRSLQTHARKRVSGSPLPACTLPARPAPPPLVIALGFRHMPPRQNTHSLSFATCVESPRSPRRLRVRPPQQAARSPPASLDKNNTQTHAHTQGTHTHKATKPGPGCATRRHSAPLLLSLRARSSPAADTAAARRARAHRSSPQRAAPARSRPHATRRAPWAAGAGSPRSSWPQPPAAAPW